MSLSRVPACLWSKLPGCCVATKSIRVPQGLGASQCGFPPEVHVVFLVKICWLKTCSLPLLDLKKMEDAVFFRKERDQEQGASLHHFYVPFTHYLKGCKNIIVNFFFSFGYRKLRDSNSRISYFFFFLNILQVFSHYWTMLFIILIVLLFVFFIFSRLPLNHMGRIRERIASEPICGNKQGRVK